MNSHPILKIKDLSVNFKTPEGLVRAVNSASFGMYEGETLGFVGESGCGKTVTALSIMGLLPTAGRIVNGSIEYGEVDLLKLSAEKMRKMRGREISMIFQEPLLCLNPVFTVGDQIVEAITAHGHAKDRRAKEEMLELLKMVGIRIPPDTANCYPHQLSGGMRQRVMIAMAISSSPSILIADEPTTALDVTIASQILELLRELKKKFKMSILMITHDLGVIAEMADSVAVMYAGEIVEYAPVRRLFKNPLHPYTKGLLDCLPDIKERKGYLRTIPGRVPDLRNLPDGCSFAERCRRAGDVCRQRKPAMVEIEPGMKVACHYASQNQFFAP